MENIWVGSIFFNEGTPFYGMVLGHIMKHPQKWMDFAQKSTIFLETSGMLPSRSTESTPIFPALRGFFFFTAQAPESPQWRRGNGPLDHRAWGEKPTRPDETH